MSLKEIELNGGDSVYCINESQLRRARDLAAADAESGARLADALGEIRRRLDRNEQAALAFLLIDQLTRKSAGSLSGD